LQSLLKLNDFENKPSFDWSFELSWGHSIIKTCFVPLLLALHTFLGPCDNFLQNKLCFCGGNNG
jgi:hypothetical protein